MWKILKTRGVDSAFVVVALTALMPEPAWAGGVPVLTLPAPAAAILAGGAIIGALVIAKLWRRK